MGMFHPRLTAQSIVTPYWERVGPELTSGEGGYVKHDGTRGAAITRPALIVTTKTATKVVVKLALARRV
jgi:hypothetical protein